MSFDIDSVRLGRLFVQISLASALFSGLAACGPKFDKSIKTGSEPSKTELEALVANEPMPQNWQHNAEHFLDMTGLKADRYEWASATQGSTGDHRKGAYGSTRYVHSTGWYGCGLAYYEKLPKGIKISPVHVAIPLPKDKNISQAHFAGRAQRACRFAPAIAGENGVMVIRKPSVGPAPKKDELQIRTIRSPFGWVRSVSYRGNLHSMAVKSGLTDKQIRSSFVEMNTFRNIAK